MAKKKKKKSSASSGGGKLRRTLFCPECDTMMRYACTKPHQHARDYLNKLIKVTRVFYWCPKCNTVANFYYREDGKVGDMYKMIQSDNDDKIRPGDFGSRYYNPG